MITNILYQGADKTTRAIFFLIDFPDASSVNASFILLPQKALRGCHSMPLTRVSGKKKKKVSSLLPFQNLLKSRGGLRSPELEG